MVKTNYRGGKLGTGDIAFFICLAVAVSYAGTSIWQSESQLRSIAAECGKLDPEAIERAAARLYVSGLPGSTITMQDANGKYTLTYPLYPFTPQEYLTKFPDCCHYYPGKLFDQKLPRRLRLEGQCGSVDVAAPGTYIKQGKLFAHTISVRTWLIDTKMNFEHASN